MSGDAEDRATLKRLFAEASELPEGQRAGFLDRECPESLRREIDELLGYADPDGFLRPSDEQAMAPPIPARIGTYAIERELGRGGMGRVYLARQERPQRQVAVKVLHQPQVGELSTRFEREAELLGRLQHPGIARVYEAGLDAELHVPFLAMEYIDGVTLGEYLRTGKPDLRQSLELLVAIADAVSHAHQKGVLHRDLKPGNVMVRAGGEPVVLDFGIARPLEEDGHGTTRQGQLIGTIAYMSPEQARGAHHEVDTRSDVYALGVLSYEVLCGRLPHELADTPMHEALRRVVEVPAVSLASRDAALPADVVTIVHKALEKERDRRYPLASAFADDLRRYLDHQPIAARPMTALYQLRMFARRNRSLVAVSLMAALAVLAGAAVAVWQAVVAHENAEREREARGRAERRLHDVKDFATRSVFQIHDRVRHLNGGAEPSRMLADLGLEALRKLHAEEGDDVELLREVAQAFIWQGRLRGGDAYHQGDSAGADECFDEGIRLWRIVVDELGAPLPRDRSNLGLAIYNKARGLIDARKLARAEKLLREAVDVMRPGVEQFPEEMDLPGDLGSVLCRLGRVLMAGDRRDEAVVQFRAGLASIEESLRRSVTPRDRVYQLRSLLVAYNWLGNSFFDARDHEAAMREYERYRAFAAQVCELMPDDELDQSNLAVAEYKIAKVLLATGSLQEALAQSERSIQRLRPLIDEAAPNLRRVDQLLGSVGQRGRILLRLGQHARVLRDRDQFEAAAALLRKAAAEQVDWHETLLELEEVHFAASLAAGDDGARRAADAFLARARTCLTLLDGVEHRFDVFAGECFVAAANGDQDALARLERRVAALGEKAPPRAARYRDWLGR